MLVEIKKNVSSTVLQDIILSLIHELWLKFRIFKKQLRGKIAINNLKQWNNLLSGVWPFKAMAECLN